MTASWMVYAAVVSALLALATWLAEPLLRARGVPGRWAWALSMAAALMVPVAGLVRGLAAPGGGAPDAGDRAITGGLRLEALAGVGGLQAPLAAAEPFLLPAWLAGSVLLATLFIAGSVRLRARANAWPKARIEETDVRISEDFGPAVLGTSIVLPRWMLSFDAERLRLAVWHEREHRSARDPGLLLAGVVAVLIAPWNPVLWWQLGRIRAAIEMDCDARVLDRGARRAAYGSLLLDVGAVASRLPAPVTALATNPSLLERRLIMIGRGAKKRGRLMTGVSSAAIVLAVVMACEATPPTGPGAGAGGVASVEPVHEPSSDAERAPWRPGRTEVAGVGESPLVYLDGIRLRGGDALAHVDPHDISRIEVIKGAAAESLFGPEAAHGVIQVFLKR